MVLTLALASLACRFAIQQVERAVPTVPTPTATSFFTRTPTATTTRTPTLTPLPSSTPTATPTPTPLVLVRGDTPIPPGVPQISAGTAGLVSALAEWNEPSVADLAWTSDGQVLAVANASTINLYEIETRALLRTLYPSKDGIVSMAFSPDGKWLVAGSRQGDEKSGYASSLDLWVGPNWKPLGLLYGAPTGLNQLVFLPKGDFMAAVYAQPGYNVSYVDFWATLTWTINTTLDAGTILNVAVSRDGEYLATSPDRYDIKVWSLTEHKLLYSLPTSFTGAVNTLAFSPDSGVLATGHYDGMLRLWEVETGDLLLQFDTGAVVQSLAFNSDGLVLASGGSFENSQVQLWSSGSGEKLRTLENPPGGISRILFSPDGHYLVSASYDGLIRLWGIRP